MKEELHSGLHRQNRTKEHPELTLIVLIKDIGYHTVMVRNIVDHLPVVQPEKIPLLKIPKENCFPSSLRGYKLTFLSSAFPTIQDHQRV